MMTNHLNASGNDFEMIPLVSRQSVSFMKLPQQLQDFTSRSPTTVRLKNKQVINA
ncbi:hypothetical protein [Secundilactobacillus pentosiphilus]|uniref:hypothetical protein n=1 Tax=Secundilactobacillus pentosiphilus TaxID=1714682 RepID=UPI0015C5F21E|nr:hypothetical protein [Secundilactobacillus pentosiphilus]